VNTFISFRTLFFIASLIMLPFLFGCNPQLLEGRPVVIESIEPLGGPLAGGTTVTINGSGFSTVEQIYFGSDKCTDLNIASDTSVTCLTPAKNSSVVVNVLVEGKANKSDTLSGAFAYQPAPTVTSISPLFGIVAGNQEITINGTGFLEGASVALGPILCKDVIVDSPIKIRCTTPASIAGTKALSVRNYDGQKSSSIVFTYSPVPIVTSVSPSSGALAGNTNVTLYGVGFEATSQVSFGSSSCTDFTRLSGSVATCKTPANLGGGEVNVSILNTDGQTSSTISAYTYQAAPTITSLDKTGGALAGGATILVTGTGFLPGSTMTFGSSPCTGNGYMSPTIFRCINPSSPAGTVDITITNPDGQFGTLAPGYTYRPAPTVSSVSPNLGSTIGGTDITVTGTGFLVGEVTTVKLGSVFCANVVVVNSTTITCTTSASSAGLVAVTVTNIDNQYGYKNSAFTYQAPPTITTLTPASGTNAGGTSVVITGTGFLTGVQVTIDGAPCTTLTRTSSTSLTCITPSNGSSGAVDVLVTNTDNQSAASVGGFTYLLPAELIWVTGFASPTPPEPDDYGQQNDNVTHTYTLKNVGEIDTSSVTVSVAGTNSAMWATATNNCSGVVLTPEQTCTVQVNFLANGATVGAYTALLNATAATGGTVNNVMTGEVVP
jgi:hypothetical protein